MAKSDKKKDSRPIGIAAGSLSAGANAPVRSTAVSKRGSPVRSNAVPSGPIAANVTRSAGEPTRVLGARSLAEPVSGAARSAVAPDPVKAASTSLTVRRASALTIQAPASHSLSKAKSPETVREPMTCKARPKDNKPKGGGGGGPRKFVPWCS